MPDQEFRHTLVQFCDVKGLIETKMLGGRLRSPALAVPDFIFGIFFFAKQNALTCITRDKYQPGLAFFETRKIKKSLSCLKV